IWKKEAKKRKLSNNISTPEALKVKVSQSVLELFEELGVMNAKESRARFEIEMEEYVMKVQIESRVIGDIARNHVVPTAVNYQNRLIQNVTGLKEIYAAKYMSLAKEPLSLIEAISGHIENINSMVSEMIESRKKANAVDEIEKRAELYCKEVKPFLGEIRYHCDKLELLVDDELWPLTKYRELLFTK
ncbi:MAG: glutamine synthetase type III, partial [Bacteroidota bacterium]